MSKIRIKFFFSETAIIFFVVGILSELRDIKQTIFKDGPLCVLSRSICLR